MVDVFCGGSFGYVCGEVRGFWFANRGMYVPLRSLRILLLLRMYGSPRGYSDIALLMESLARWFCRLVGIEDKIQG